MTTAPVMTTVFTTISGVSDVSFALIALLAVEPAATVKVTD